MGWQLRDRLMNESILCMNGTLQTVYDQQMEINRLKKLVNSTRNVDISNAIEGKEIEIVGTLKYRIKAHACLHILNYLLLPDRTFSFCLFVCFDLGFHTRNPVIKYRPDASCMSHMEAHAEMP